MLPIDTNNNSVAVILPENIEGGRCGKISGELNGRIIYVKEEGWKRATLGVIMESDFRYMQQKNSVLRGNNSRPIAALTQGQSVLEWYPSNGDDKNIIIVKAPYDADYIPASLVDITAWKLAEIVLMSMHDVQSSSICTAKVNEHLAQL